MGPGGCAESSLALATPDSGRAVPCLAKVEKQVTKVFQSDWSVSLLVRERESGSYHLLHVPLPSRLQHADSTAADITHVLMKEHTQTFRCSWRYSSDSPGEST